MAKIGYGRVGKRDQHPESQHDTLTAAGCDRIFIDKASGKLSRRPQLDAALEYLREGDQFVITRLDRLGRSTRHLLDLAGDLDRRHVDFAALQQGIDTTTPGGRLFFVILAGIAEFERELIRERTLDGLEAARARGRVGGRKPVMTPEKIAVARQMYDSQEHTLDAIAKTVGVSRATIYRHLDPGKRD